MFIYQKLRLSSTFAFRAIIVLFFRAFVWRVPRRGSEDETENEREKADEMEGKKCLKRCRSIYGYFIANDLCKNSPKPFIFRASIFIRRAWNRFIFGAFVSLKMTAPMREFMWMPAHYLWLTHLIFGYIQYCHTAPTENDTIQFIL